jgi:transcriptional regulator with XRE-family HTH domain
MQAVFNNSGKEPYNVVMPGGRPTTKEASFLGNRIAHARNSAGLSQNELAEKIGISRSLIAQWERSAIALKAEQLLTLSAALHISIDELLGKKPTKRGNGPTGRAQKLFEDVSLLPRRKQERILAMVEDMLIAQAAKQKAS